MTVLTDVVAEVSINLGDLLVGTVTGGTAAAPIDTADLSPDGFYTGGEFAYTTGLNAGQARKILGWSNSSHAWSLQRAMPFAPAAGDAYEVRRYNMHNRDAIKTFITQAARGAARQSWVSLSAMQDLGYNELFTLNRKNYPVPPDLEFVHRILWFDTNDTSAPGYTPSYELPYRFWTSNVDGQLLITSMGDRNDLGTYDSPIPDQAPIDLHGSRRPIVPVNETDVIEFEGNYLQTYASARMALRLARAAQDQADFQAKFEEFYKLEADEFRGTRRALPGGSRKIRN